MVDMARRPRRHHRDSALSTPLAGGPRRASHALLTAPLRRGSEGGTHWPPSPTSYANNSAAHILALPTLAVLSPQHDSTSVRLGLRGFGLILHCFFVLFLFCESFLQ